VALSFFSINNTFIKVVQCIGGSCILSLLYRVSGDFISVLKDLILGAISSQKFHMNISRLLVVTQLWIFEIQDDLHLT
jgi:hypothetical protein